MCKSGCRIGAEGEQVACWLEHEGRCDALAVDGACCLPDRLPARCRTTCQPPGIRATGLASAEGRAATVARGTETGGRPKDAISADK